VPVAEATDFTVFDEAYSSWPSVSGKLKLNKNDSHVSLAGDIHLRDGSIVKESNLWSLSGKDKAGETYDVTGSLISMRKHTARN
jgi:hypothetical protein